MKQSLEIEFKNMLTEAELERLAQHYHVTENDWWTQINYYFETTCRYCQANKRALRIRKLGQDFVATLKIPQETGLLETDVALTPEEAMAILKGDVERSPGFTELRRMAAPEHVTWELLGSLETKRAEVQDAFGTIVLDISTYFNVTDYELEYEVTDYEQGLQSFKRILAAHNISVVPTKNKVARFFQQYEQMKE
ncbi:MAG: CYTH domain-containing protein [Bacilli bacterium]